VVAHRGTRAPQRALGQIACAEVAGGGGARDCDHTLDLTGT
jgi:hypothetical protein